MALIAVAIDADRRDRPRLGFLDMFLPFVFRITKINFSNAIQIRK
jgi:hypothetical protein